MNLLLNALAFKVAWIASVIGGARDLPALVVTAVVATIGFHLWRAAHPGRELAIVVLAGFIGLAWDSVIVAAGWVSYPTGIIVAGLAPYWIVAMWMAFATTLNVMFRGLRDRLGLAALLGAIFGPMSYVAGSSVGAVAIELPLMALGSLSVAWAVIMPILIIAACQLDGTPAPAGEAA